MKKQFESPTGLHKKYYIQKIVPRTKRRFFTSWFDNNDFDLEPLDEGFEGFVLRLDKGGDPKHVEACRKAVLVYADEIRDYLPDLSKDLIERYS